MFLRRVRRFNCLVALLLAILWMPLTSHCLLEDAGWIHHDRCCDSGDGNDDGHDAADGICRIEKAGFQIPKLQRLLAKLVPDALSARLRRLVVIRTEAVRPGLLCRAGPPPALHSTWQFSYRSALPPRAPSSVS